MPSTYAHYRFGKEVLERLDPDLRSVIEAHRELYDIGLHGPDILFYYDALHRNPVSQIGFSMHDRPEGSSSALPANASPESGIAELGNRTSTGSYAISPWTASATRTSRTG